MKPDEAANAAAAMRRTLGAAAETLTHAGVGNPRLDAEVMLADAAGVTRAQVVADLAGVDAAALVRFAAMVARRATREPLAYILGRREFHSLELEITPAVLVPRAESETVVAAALEFLAGRIGARVLDIGTGSGALVLAIAAAAPGTRAVATDISADALVLARRNAERLALAGRVEFVEADCWNPVPGGETLGSFDLVVSNPPYICDGDIERLQPEIARFEPRMALAGGPDGLDFYRRIAAEIGDHLLAGGALMVELGAGQAEAAGAIFHTAGATAVSLHPDLAGIARVARVDFCGRMKRPAGGSRRLI